MLSQFHNTECSIVKIEFHAFHAWNEKNSVIVIVGGSDVLNKQRLELWILRVRILLIFLSRDKNRFPKCMLYCMLYCILYCVRSTPWFYYAILSCLPRQYVLHITCNRLHKYVSSAIHSTLILHLSIYHKLYDILYYISSHLTVTKLL